MEGLETFSRTDPGGLTSQGTGIGSMWYGIGNTGVTNPSTARWRSILTDG